MQYRRMGRTGLRISTVSIGGWLTFGGSIDDATAKKIVRRAIDGGVNFVDLADVYARGQAEKSAGRILKDYKRRDLVLSSKVFGRMGDGPNDAGLSRKHVVESVERSLKRLKTDYLDLYFCHRADPNTPLDETARAMDDLVHQGKVLYWGTSVWPADLLREAHQLADRRNLHAPWVEQPEYSLLERSIERDVLPAARELGMGVVAWSPLAGGLLTGKYNDGVPEGSRGATTQLLDAKRTPQNLERLRTFVDVAAEAGLEPSVLALAWVLSREGMTSVITGATRPEHVVANLAAADTELPEDVARRLDELFPADEAVPAG